MQSAKRVWVPECVSCKAIWEDADPHFRNIVLSAWHPEILPNDNRSDKMMRSFKECDGKKRCDDFFKHTVKVKINGKDRLKIFPLKDEKFVLVLKRIIRGLCHEHELGTAIPESAVECDTLLDNKVLDHLEAEIIWKVIADSFIRYGYIKGGDEETSSTWIVEIGSQMKFIAWVKKTPHE